MHEMSIVSSIMNIALMTADENRLSKINKIKVQIGDQRHLAPDLLEYAFSFSSKKTIAEGAVLIIEKIPVTMTCLECKNTFTVEDRIYICPECESVNLQMNSGRELIIECIEGEK